MPRPDFSAEMLATFLYARAMARDGFSGRSRRECQDEFARELMGETGLPWSIIRRAFAGRLHDGDQRALLWQALGHVADCGTVSQDGRRAA